MISPAKINLYLNILGKYPSGYHRIESIVERISLCDEITLKLTAEPGVKVYSNRKDLQSDTNLCCKAYRLLKENLEIPCGVDIFLKKNIPVGAGLGGGSSNAAATLLGLNLLFNLKMSVQQLMRCGEQLGSDVNFFLSESQFALLYERGQKVMPLKGRKFHHALIWPGISLSTAEVYKNARVKLTKFLSNANILRYALTKGDRYLLMKNAYNVLEKSAFGLCSELAAVRNYFLRKGVFFELTGSGSALYATVAKEEYQSLRRNIPKKWLFFAVQTF